MGGKGILVKLFRLIDKGLPVPLIGSGQTAYQMVSVFDVVSAIEKAVEKGLPNREYNLGSANPKSTREVLTSVIHCAKSKSFLISTPGWLVKLCLAFLEKIGLPLMYREQYKIADINYLVDTTETTAELGWAPQYSDGDMMKQAFLEYKNIL